MVSVCNMSMVRGFLVIAGPHDVSLLPYDSEPHARDVRQL